MMLLLFVAVVEVLSDCGVLGMGWSGVMWLIVFQCFWFFVFLGFLGVGVSV